MKEVHVGVYVLDGMLFDLVLVPGRSGEFYWPLSPASKLSRPICRLGWEVAWHEMVKELVHELFEAAAMERQCLFEKTTWMTDNSSGRHTIHCDHAQFSQICDDVGDIITYALPKLSEAYAKCGSARKKKVRRMKK